MKVRKAVLTLAVLATVAVAVPSSPAGAATSVGRFFTLPEGEARGLEISGIAILSRKSDTTKARIIVRGLVDGVTYAAHLHGAPCSENMAGGHYQNVPGGAAAPPNELWLSSTDGARDGITPEGGVAIGRGTAEWVARPEARAVIIHFIPPGGNTGGGPKIACADL